MRRLKQHPMFPVFLVVFLGFVGFSLPFPIFAPLFLDSEKYHILPNSYSIEWRTLILGLSLATYPLGQFLGLPLLGQLSDHYGRKKILIVSLLGTLLSYILSALAILWGSLWLLLVSRFICGYTEGNFSIAQSIAADISHGNQRTKNFSIINIAVSLGFVFGPILGGKLSDPHILSWFNFTVPFWFAAFLSIFTIVVIVFQLPETHSQKKDRPKKKIHPFIGLSILHRNFSRLGMRTLYTISFLFFFGLFFFYQFYPTFLVRRYQYNASQIADVAAYIGVFLAATQIGIVHPLAKRMRPRTGVIIGALCLAPVLIILSFNKTLTGILITLPFATAFMSLSTTNLQTLVSHSAPQNIQGEVLGVNTSVQILGEFITCIIGGLMAGTALVGLPLVFGGLMVFVAALVAVAFTSRAQTPEH